MVNEQKNLKVFGYGLAVVLAFIAYKVWRGHGWVAVHAALLAGIFLFILVTAVRYQALKPLYIRWMKVAHFIGTVITGIILSVLFYGVFGVTGLILRLMRKDLLDRKWDAAAASYWIPKGQAAFEPEHYTRQF
ncbi:MAG: hypothetical protein A3C36_00750 [Omnitrophica WOR_2 bacterium RIFCSPHIGHO2_02_FULL_52_10]|nr:MAG: hypothetical protein A3C36_00750 [Omnitrophica WOR_2 bacterium RIFCSPHIGHO2_02_FULL_52_10]